MAAPPDGVVGNAADQIHLAFAASLLWADGKDQDAAHVTLQNYSSRWNPPRVSDLEAVEISGVPVLLES